MGMFDRLRKLRDTLKQIGKELQQKAPLPASPPPPPQIRQQTVTAAGQQLDWDVRLPKESGAADKQAKPDQHHELRGRLHSRAALHQAIVIKEILDRPLALRRRR